MMCLICRDENALGLFNLCNDLNHSICIECFHDYMSVVLNEPFCRPIVCFGEHQVKQRLNYNIYMHYLVPDEILRREKQAQDTLLLLCGNCHTQRSLLCSPTQEETIASWRTMESYPDFASLLEKLQVNELSIENFYILLKEMCVSLREDAPIEARNMLNTVLSCIADPELRCAVQLHHYRFRPRVITNCCGKEHCFRCKTEVHDNACEENMGSLDNRLVFCPRCSLILTKGDGCAIVTCICGESFSWYKHVKETELAMGFARRFPVDTAKECARVLISARAPHPHQPSPPDDEESIKLYEEANSWRLQFRQESDIGLLDWWKQKYFPYEAHAAASCLHGPSCIGSSDNISRDVYAIAANLWSGSNKKATSRAVQQIKSITGQSFFCSFAQHDRACAALRILRGEITKNSIESQLPSLDLLAGAELFASMNPDLMINEEKAYEVRGLEQILFLYGSSGFNDLQPSSTYVPVRRPFNTKMGNHRLEYTTEGFTARRPGSISSYPAALLDLPSSHTSCVIHLDEAPYHLNWFTIGLARKPFRNQGSNGFGCVCDSWGLRDDRSNSGDRQNFSQVLASDEPCTRWRKLESGDRITILVDLIAGRLRFELNNGESIHEFRSAPQGHPDDFVLGCTLSSDTQVSLVPIDSASIAWFETGGDMKKEMSTSSLCSIESDCISNDTICGIQKRKKLLNADHSAIFIRAKAHLSTLASNIIQRVNQYSKERKLELTASVSSSSLSDSTITSMDGTDVDDSLGLSRVMSSCSLEDKGKLLSDIPLPLCLPLFSVTSSPDEERQSPRPPGSPSHHPQPFSLTSSSSDKEIEAGLKVETEIISTYAWTNELSEIQSNLSLFKTIAGQSPSSLALRWMDRHDHHMVSVILGFKQWCAAMRGLGVGLDDGIEKIILTSVIPDAFFKHKPQDTDSESDSLSDSSEHSIKKDLNLTWYDAVCGLYWLHQHVF
jgi:hypothetical protein